MNIYLVGGAVRDQLLGLPIRERDWVVVGGSREEMLAARYLQVGKDFPVFLHPETGEEYALARTERKTAPGYHGFEFESHSHVTLEEDLLRRDLTINAMAQTETGEIIDPFGGQADLQQRILRHVSPAFSEDPVRILRIARFMAKLSHLGFTIANETQTLMCEMVKAGEVDALVPERVWKEMERALSETRPRAFIETLRNCGALARIFPALDKLWGVPQKLQWHPEGDTGIHTLMVLDQVCELSLEPRLRFAALCHDLGKGETPVDILPSHHGHEERGAPLIRQWCDRHRVPHAHRDLAVAVSRFHLHSHRVFELKPSTIYKVLEKLDSFRNPEKLESFLLCCEADAKGRLGLETRPYPQADFFREAFREASRVSAASLMAQGLQGPALGSALKKVRIQTIQVCRERWNEEGKI